MTAQRSPRPAATGLSCTPRIPTPRERLELLRSDFLAERHEARERGADLDALRCIRFAEAAETLMSLCDRDAGDREAAASLRGEALLLAARQARSRRWSRAHVRRLLEQAAEALEQSCLERGDNVSMLIEALRATGRSDRAAQLAREHRVVAAGGAPAPRPAPPSRPGYSVDL